MPRALLLGISRADLPGPVAILISHMLHLNDPVPSTLPYHGKVPGDLRAVDDLPAIQQQRPGRSHRRVPDPTIAGSEEAPRSRWRISSRKFDRVRGLLASLLRAQVGSPACP